MSPWTILSRPGAASDNNYGKGLDIKKEKGAQKPSVAKICLKAKSYQMTLITHVCNKTVELWLLSLPSDLG